MAECGELLLSVQHFLIFGYLGTFCGEYLRLLCPLRFQLVDLPLQYLRLLF